MNFDRTDAFLLTIIILHVYILREMVLSVGYNTFAAASNFSSISAVINTLIFFVGVVFLLKGIQTAVDGYFMDSKLKDIAARSAGYSMIAVGFLYVTLNIVTRIYG